MSAADLERVSFRRRGRALVIGTRHPIKRPTVREAYVPLADEMDAWARSCPC